MSPGGPHSIERFSDLEDYVSLRGLEGPALIFLLKYMTGWSGDDKFLRLWGLFGDDFLLFLSIFQGETIRVPPINTLQRMKTDIRIYTFLWEKGFSERAFALCEKTFGKKRHRLEKVVERVEKFLSRVKSGTL